MINTEIRMTLFMRDPRLVMQIEFMAKSYGALAVVNVTLLAFRSRRWREIRLTRLNANAKGKESNAQTGGCIMNMP